MSGEAVTELAEPWVGFLREIDANMTQQVELHCVGGFVLHVLYQLPRPTADIDFIAVAPMGAVRELMELAGPKTALARRYGIYLQFVTVSDFPDDYIERLVDIAKDCFESIRLRALVAEDLVLSKLTRNSPKDLYDVRHLAGRGAIDRRVLLRRYEERLRPYLSNTDRHDLTLQLWLEEIADALPVP